jgi:hypothetical protein
MNFFLVESGYGKTGNRKDIVHTSSSVDSIKYGIDMERNMPRLSL